MRVVASSDGVVARRRRRSWSRRGARVNVPPEADQPWAGTTGEPVRLDQQRGTRSRSCTTLNHAGIRVHYELVGDGALWFFPPGVPAGGDGPALVEGATGERRLEGQGLPAERDHRETARAELDLRRRCRIAVVRLSS